MVVKFVLDPTSSGLHYKAVYRWPDARLGQLMGINKGTSPYYKIFMYVLCS